MYFFSESNDINQSWKKINENYKKKHKKKNTNRQLKSLGKQMTGSLDSCCSSAVCEKGDNTYLRYVYNELLSTCHGLKQVPHL